MNLPLILKLNSVPIIKIPNAAKTIKKGSPNSKIYIQTIMPINNKQYLKDKPYVKFLWKGYSPSINEQVLQLNNFIIQNKDFEIIDLHPSFLNKQAIVLSSECLGTGQ